MSQEDDDPFKGEITDPETVGFWSVRFRFRIAKALTSEEPRLRFVADGQTLIIGSEDFTTPLKQSRTVVVLAHSFPDKELAEEYAQKLRLGMMIATIEQENGIDAGSNIATSQIGAELKSKIESTGVRLLPDIHGTQVYYRTGKERIFAFHAKGSVTADPDMLFSTLDGVMAEKLNLEPELLTSIEILSLSRMALEALTEATLCLAAVESLPAPDGDWPPDQLTLLNRLAQEARAAIGISPSEAEEVASAIERSFKSIRQRLKRVILVHLEMSAEDWRDFDRVYTRRSSIFHGKVHPTKETVQELATEARKVCGRIILCAARRAPKA